MLPRNVPERKRARRQRPQEGEQVMNEVRARLLEIAHVELNNANPREYWQDTLGTWAADHSKGYHWCGVFCLWCLRRVELCDWTWSIAKDKPGFLFRLPRTTTPEPGDIAYFDAPYQHHALVQRVEGDRLYVIQGNYGTPGHVAESDHSIRDRRPAFYSIERLVADRLALANRTGQ